MKETNQYGNCISIEFLFSKHRNNEKLVEKYYLTLRIFFPKQNTIKPTKSRVLHTCGIIIHKYLHNITITIKTDAKLYPILVEF